MTCIKWYFKTDLSGLQSAGGAPMLEILILTKNNTYLLIYGFKILFTSSLVPLFLLKNYNNFLFLTSTRTTSR